MKIVGNTIGTTMNPKKLGKYLLSGTWMLKDVFDARIVGSVYGEYCVDFISNNIRYDRILSIRTGGSSWFFKYVRGEGDTAIEYNVEHTHPTKERHIISITSEADRKITFIGVQSVSKEFYEWFTANATFITANIDWEKITDYVDKEIAEFDFVKVVDELPEEGLPNREYFVRKANADETSNDLFDEYAWINIRTEEEPNWGWEFKGTKTLEIDLTDYVKKTDYAVDNGNAGIVKTAGVSYGIQTGANGLIFVKAASRYEIEQKTALYKPITPDNLDYAVKVGMTTNTIVLTAEEKAAAQAWLGVTDLVGDISSALDELHTYAQNLVNGGAS